MTNNTKTYPRIDQMDYKQLSVLLNQLDSAIYRIGYNYPPPGRSYHWLLFVHDLLPLLPWIRAIICLCDTYKYTQEREYIVHQQYHEQRQLARDNNSNKFTLEYEVDS